MSRLAKRPIVLPKGIELKQSKNVLQVKGPKGSLEKHLPEGVSVAIDGENVNVTIDEKKLKKPFLGLYRSLINNMVIGASEGFEKKLTLIGVGYRAAVKGNSLDLQLGFSHPSILEIPSAISVKVEKSTTIVVSGPDKQLVGQFAANIRSLRPPEPYKGKGVRYEDEYVRKKAGKAAKGK